MPLHAELFSGPLDIVGDVHGEFDALLRLLQHLGYKEDGSHPGDRRLIFLGDLVDRGHDSPAVLELVIEFVKQGRAQCVLGNHELNILAGVYGHGNGWILTPEHGEGGGDSPSVPVPESRKADYMSFMDSLPLVLENDHLRVVHACWDHESVAALAKLPPQANESGPGKLKEALNYFDNHIQDALALDNVLESALQYENTFFDTSFAEDEWQPRPLPGHTMHEFAISMQNPLRVLTTSVVRPTAIPYYGAGRWRMTERIPWWNTYADARPVVIGHFWRQFSSAPRHHYGVFGQDVLRGVPPHDWMGLRRNVYCTDYSVGQLHMERRLANRDYEGKLAALRYPEWSVMHDDGALISVGQPGLDRHNL